MDEGERQPELPRDDVDTAEHQKSPRHEANPARAHPLESRRDPTPVLSAVCLIPLAENPLIVPSSCHSIPLSLHPVASLTPSRTQS